MRFEADLIRRNIQDKFWLLEYTNEDLVCPMIRCRYTTMRKMRRHLRSSKASVLVHNAAASAVLSQVVTWYSRKTSTVHTKLKLLDVLPPDSERKRGEDSGILRFWDFEFLRFWERRWPGAELVCYHARSVRPGVERWCVVLLRRRHMLLPPTPVQRHHGAPAPAPWRTMVQAPGAPWCRYQATDTNRTFVVCNLFGCDCGSMDQTGEIYGKGSIVHPPRSCFLSFAHTWDEERKLLKKTRFF